MRAVKVPLMPFTRRKRAARSADLRIVYQHVADLVAMPTGLDWVGALGGDGAAATSNTSNGIAIRAIVMTGGVNCNWS